MNTEMAYALITGVVILLIQAGCIILFYHFWWKQQQFASRQEYLEELIRSLSPSMIFKMEREFGTKVIVGDEWREEWTPSDVEEAETVKPFDPFEKEDAPWR